MAILYSQTREESAGLLKLVIAEMGRHVAPFNPDNFAVWYEHLAGINPGLSQAIKAALAVQPALGAETMDALHRAHVAEIDDDATQVAQGRFEKAMGAMAEQAAATDRDARDFSAQLEGLSRVLSTEGASASEMSPQVERVADGTHRMQSALADLTHAVSEGQSEIERLRQELTRSRTEAITDALSQLLNRKGFDDALRKLMSRPAASGSAHCLLMLDIDHFKRVNDTFGHPVGDTVIQTLGQLLGRVTNSPGQWAGRVGGEEFAILLSDSSLAQAVKLAQVMRSLIGATKIRRRGSDEVLTSVTVSVGVAASIAGDDALSLMSAADAALYRSKAAGRDRVTTA